MPLLARDTGRAMSQENVEAFHRIYKQWYGSRKLGREL
jgi:hypothetical protein